MLYEEAEAIKAEVDRIITLWNYSELGLKTTIEKQGDTYIVVIKE